MDIPEFYETVEEMFTPEEAEVNNAFPREPITAKDLAVWMNRDEAEIEKILESMANKKTVYSSARAGPTEIKFPTTLFLSNSIYPLVII
jgi:hypothetical protein